MNNEDLLKLWRGMPSEGTMDEHIVRYGRMVQEATIEECAKACLEQQYDWAKEKDRDMLIHDNACFDCAAAIRALSSGSPAPLPAAVPAGMKPPFDEEVPLPCNDEIHQNGVVIAVMDCGMQAMEGLVKEANRTEPGMDWHYFGGRALVKTLGDASKARAALERAMPRFLDSAAAPAQPTDNTEGESRG